MFLFFKKHRSGQQIREVSSPGVLILPLPIEPETSLAGGRTRGGAHGFEIGERLAVAVGHEVLLRFTADARQCQGAVDARDSVRTFHTCRLNLSLRTRCIGTGKTAFFPLEARSGGR